jgi:cysteine-rich repeat protein
VRQLSPANKSNAFNGDPVAYGGSRFGAENAEVIYAFFETAATTVYTRTTAGVTLTAGTPLPPLATYVSDIVLDPDDWRTAYVADNSGTVYVTTNTGASWTNITGNLSTLNLGLPLHAIEFVRSPAGDAIYVGGARGVFKMPTATPGVWTEYGTGIPEADVWDLGYDAADDLLVASTLGRGAWTVTDVAGVVCGDSVVEAPEICDAGGESAACDTDCTPTFCGDGWLNSTALELCDDGNMTNGDGCDDDVFLGGSCGAPRCGNGTVEGSEQCDDGNNVEGDGCSATCVNELCGDGIVNDGVLVDLILNGNFESGAFAPWVRSNAGSGTFLIATPGANAPLSGFATQGNAGGGSFYAIADTDGPGAHALAQTFTVPWNATSVVLSFEMFVNDWSGVGPIVHPNGLDFNATPNQHARVDLLAAGSGAFDTGTTVVANLYLNVDPGSSPHTYTPYTFDLTGVAAPGGSYVLRFAEVDNQFYQNLGVDNVHVVALVPEECDDGGTTPGDGCNATCHLEFCGDGIVNDVHDDELIVNGSFETNTLVPWSVTNFGSGDFFVGSNGAAAPISGNPTAVNPAGGSYYAVQDTTGPGTHALRQDFVVPSSAVAVELRFEMFVNDWSGAGPIVSPGGLDHTAGPNQHARVDILAAGSPALDTGAGVVRNVYLGVDPAAPNAYTPYSFDVTGTVAPGTTYALRFAEVDNQNYQNLGVDNVRIIASTFEECDDGNQNNADGCTTSCQYGCQSSAECDDGNPCTDDACTVQFSCLYTPIPDTDGDGSCDAVDNCPHTPNPGNGTARFPEPIRASNTTAFSWSVPRDVQWVRGNLAAVSSYSYIEFVGSGFATSITSGSVPAPGSGFYYLVKPWCPATTWSSGGAGECAVPGSCPAGGRDGNLP